jgi:hypothetical protein
MLGGKSLTITVEDIYFIISLSHRGEVPNFTTHGGVLWTINDYINEYYQDGTMKTGSQVPIKHITNLSLPQCLIGALRCFLA